MGTKSWRIFVPEPDECAKRHDGSEQVPYATNSPLPMLGNDFTRPPLAPGNRVEAVRSPTPRFLAESGVGVSTLTMGIAQWKELPRRWGSIHVARARHTVQSGRGTRHTDWNSRPSVFSQLPIDIAQWKELPRRWGSIHVL